MKTLFSRINRFRKPISLVLCFCLIMTNLITFKNNTAEADQEDINVSTVGNTRMFRYTDRMGTQADLLTPLYMNSLNEATYCIELEASSPLPSVVYHKDDSIPYLSDTTKAGVEAILQWGYPMNDSFMSNYSLTAEEAQTATTVAIKKYLSACGVYHSGYDWGFGDSIAPKGGYENVYNAMMYLYENAANRIYYDEVHSKLEFIERTSDTYYYYFKYAVSDLSNADLSVSNIKGYNIINNNDGTVTIKVLKSGNYGAEALITLNTYNSNSKVGISFISPTEDIYQHMVSSKKLNGIADKKETTFAIPATGNIKVYKTDKATSKPLAGAVFEVFYEAACTNHVGYIQTDATGYGTLTVDTDTSVYYVKEIYAPAGYKIDDSSVKAVPVNTTYNFEDSAILSTIGIHKTASDTKEGLQGVVFGIYTKAVKDSNGVVTGVDESSKIQEMTTDKGGNATSEALTPSTITGVDSNGFTTFDENTCYYIKEISSAPGYAASLAVFGPMPAVTSFNYTFEFIANNPLGGRIGLTKVEEGTSIALSGATYGIYTDEACTKLAKYNYMDEKNPYAEGSNLPDAIITTSASESMSGWMSPGTYYVKEITAPYGYGISDVVTTVTIGKGTSLKQIQVSDKKVTGSVSVKKLDEKTKDYVKGAEYGLFSDSECKNLVKAFAPTNEYGTTRINNLPLRDYYVKEVKAPEGYELNPSVYPVTLKYKDQNTLVIYQNIDTTNAKSTVTFRKVDENGKPLAGADIKLVDTVTKQEVMLTTAGNDEVFNVVSGRLYEVYEMKAPAGYTLAEKISFNAKAGDIITMTDYKVIDPDVSVEVIIKKIDENGNFVNGAVLSVTDSKGKEVYKITTNDKEGIKLSLIGGYVYKINEISVPDGYLKADEVSFTATAGGTVNMVDKSIKYTASKIDNYGESIKGAKLSVIDSKGNVIDEFTSDGKPHLIRGLKLGESYSIHESEAPEGYKLTDDVNFTVNKEAADINIVDEKIPVITSSQIVQTGDLTDIRFLVTIMICSMLLMWGFLPQKKEVDITQM